MKFTFSPDKCDYCRIQPVYVVDVAAALTAALKDDGTSMGKIYELGGPEVFTMHELVSSDFISICCFLYSISCPNKRYFLLGKTLLK
jgi:NADH dehydrogenase (ubiquinone) 1 alpha subcomplex subunit 9